MIGELRDIPAGAYMLPVMKPTLKLHEAGGRIAPREDVPGEVYKIRIMGWPVGADTTEGSSADYPVAALKASVPDAFPKGTRMRANHDGLCEGGGDVKRLVGKTLETPWPEEDGMYTNARIAPAYQEMMEQFADAIGVSISAAGELEMEPTENEDDEPVPKLGERGKPILKRLLSAEESPYNSIDFVEAPGADGRIMALVTEAAKKSFAEMNIREQTTFASAFIEKKTSEAVPPQINKEETHMDEAEKEALAAKITASVTEALRPKETPVEVRGEDVAEAAIAAGIPQGLRSGVYEAVRGGKTVEEAVAAGKAIAESLRSEFKAEFEKESASVAPGYTSGVGSTFKPTESIFDELDQIAGVK